MAGLACLVVGGGRIGARKARTLASHGARVTVLSPHLCDALADMVSAGKVSWRRERYTPKHLDGFALVIAATSQSNLNIQIGRDADRRGMLSCVVSSGRFSRVVFPARYEQDGLTVSVHSSGLNCERSKRLRDKLAAVLRYRDGRNRLKLGVVGIRRGDVSPDVFRSLTQLAVSAERDDMPVRDTVLLATCWRWECYFLSRTPRYAGGEIRRFLLHSTSETTGNSDLSVTSQRYGVGAYYHLLRVLSGLDSPLPGETEIVGQVRSAAERWLDGASTPLGEIFATVMQAQKEIREEVALSPLGTGWVDAAIQRVTTLASGGVLVVGCGKLGTALANRLSERGLAVTSFSERAELPPESVATERIGEFLGSSDVVVLCSQLPDEQARLLARRARNNGLIVVDLEGGHTLLRDAAPSRYFGPKEIAGCVSGAEAARIAAAENLTVRKAILWQVRKRPPDRFTDTIRITGRSSSLSKVQIQEVTALLELLDPDISHSIAMLETPGDRDRSTPLPLVTEDDFFTRDLDDAVLNGQADLAVHSAKDLPERLVEGLCVAAVLPSVATWECLVSRDGATLAHLPPVARVGTSSRRRQDALVVLRPDLLTANVRGDVPDRIRQMDEGRFDALILAAAGLIRLGLEDRISEVFSPDVFAPAPGQGSLVLVVRAEDMELRRFLEPLDLADRRHLPWQ